MTIKRNHPCPCGSDKRYKSCCAVLQNNVPASVQDRACLLVDQGNIMLGDENHEEALKLYQEALDIYPEYARAHYNIGVVLEKTGAKEKAVASFMRALSFDPEDAYAHYNIGVIWQDQGKEKEAADCFQQAISIRPDYFEAHYNLGVIYKNQGMLEKSVVSFQDALAIKPSYANALNNLGTVTQEQGLLSDAAGYYTRALAVKNDFAEAHYNLGIVREEQGRLQDAADCYQKALVIKPDYTEAYHNLGSVQYTQGKFKEARTSFQKALSIKNDYAKSHFLMSSLQKYSGNEHHLIEMKNLFSHDHLNDEQKMYLAFGLGKAYEDSGVYEKAFYYLKEGNRLKRKTYDYSIEETKTEFEQIKNTFTKSFILNNAKLGNPDNTPIFILGMPRSGTSLVEQILVSHPDVYGAGELYYLGQTISQLAKADSVNQICENISNAGEEIITRLGLEYLRKISTFSPKKKFITDKMPQNFLWIGAIILALPNAKIISCTRDPMDNCLSIYKNNFAKGQKYAYDLQELGHYHLRYQDLMRYWHEVFPGKIYAINYEKLVDAQETETRKLLKHCGLSWDEACLSFHKTSRAVATASAVQVRKPIYKESVQLWKKYEKQLQPLSKLLSG